MIPTLRSMGCLASIGTAMVCPIVYQCLQTLPALAMPTLASAEQMAKQSEVKPPAPPTCALKSEKISAPQSAKDFFERGLEWHRSGKWDCAIADYSQSIQLNDQSAVAHYNRGLVFYRKAKFDQAITDYNKALQLKPKDEMTYYSRGLAFSKKGRKPDAIADFQKVLEFAQDLQVQQNAQKRLIELGAR